MDLLHPESEVEVFWNLIKDLFQLGGESGSVRLKEIFKSLLDFGRDVQEGDTSRYSVLQKSSLYFTTPSTWND